MKTLKINYLAVLAVVIFGQIIPMGWYTLFRAKWMVFNNLTMEMGDKAGAMPYVSSVIYTAGLGWMLAWIFKRMNVESAMDGLKTGLYMGIVFSLLYNIMMNLFSMRPYPLSWIDGGAGIIMFTISGLILGGWRKYELVPAA